MVLVRMVAFSARVRQWRDDKPGGLAVVDVPAALVADLGGRRQMRVTGNLNGHRSLVARCSLQAAACASASARRR